MSHEIPRLMISTYDKGPVLVDRLISTIQVSQMIPYYEESEVFPDLYCCCL